MSPGPARSRSGFPWRALLYLAVILLLVADLHWFHGPLWRRLERNRALSKLSLERALDRGWVATVNGEPLSREQLDLAAAVHFFRQGKDPATLSPAAMAIGRRVALSHLIEDTLIRQYCAAEGFTADPVLVRRRIDEFRSQFPDSAALSARLAAAGLDEPGLAAAIGEEERQRQWLEARVSEAAAVTESELREWFDAHAGTDPGAESPPLVRVRQVFLSTVVEDTPEREARIRECHRLLLGGEAAFETLAAGVSEDERTRHHGGDLGWFGPDRMPRDFADVAFGLRPGELSEPFRSSIGWHLIEVTDQRPPERLGFEALKPEIRAWLETERRRYALRVLVNRLKTVAVVKVFPDNLAPGPGGQ